MHCSGLIYVWIFSFFKPRCYWLYEITLTKHKLFWFSYANQNTHFQFSDPNGSSLFRFSGSDQISHIPIFLLHDPTTKLLLYESAWGAVVVYLTLWTKHFRADKSWKHTKKEPEQTSQALFVNKKGQKVKLLPINYWQIFPKGLSTLYRQSKCCERICKHPGDFLHQKLNCNYPEGKRY